MSQIRYKYANKIDLGTVYRYSCQVEGLPATNVQEPIRLKVWRTESGFHVSAYNRNIPFRDTATGAVKNATVASGTYTGSALASVIKTALDLAGTYPNHVVSYNTTTNKFILTKSPTASILKLEFNTATQRGVTMAQLLGFAHATDYSGSTNYSSPNTTHGNEHEIVLNLAATATVNCFIIDKHNLGAGTVIRYRIANTATAFVGGAWTANAGILRSATLTRSATLISIEHTATLARAIQLYWYDRSQPYSEIGRLWAGVYFAPEYRDAASDVTWQKKTLVQRTRQTEAESGAILVDKRDPVTVWEVEVDPLDPYFNAATKTGYEAFFDAVGNDVAFYVSFDAADLNGTTEYGVLQGDVIYERLRNTPVMVSRMIRIREQK